MKKLFTEKPTVEEMFATATGTLEAEYPCDFCVKDCKKEKGVSFLIIWCKDAEFASDV